MIGVTPVGISRGRGQKIQKGKRGVDSLDLKKSGAKGCGVECRFK